MILDLYFVHLMEVSICHDKYGPFGRKKKSVIQIVLMKIIILLWETMPKYSIKNIEERKDFEKFRFYAINPRKAVFSIRPYL